MNKKLWTLTQGKLEQRRNESKVCVFYSNMNIIKVLKFQGIEIVV
jgi:hypothetical protein